MIPITGVWVADLLLEGLDYVPAAGSACSLSVLATERSGTVLASGYDAGAARVRCCGGRGKLDAPELAPQDWRGYDAGTIAAQCLAEAGEVAGPGWSSLGSQPCAHWKRFRGPLRGCLRRLARLFGGDLHWRSARTGEIDLLDDSAWPDNSGVVSTLGRSWPHERCLEAWTADATLEPGQSISAWGAMRRIDRAQYEWGADVRVMVWWVD